MKKVYRYFLMIFVSLCTNTIFAADEWKGPGTITSVQPEMYRTGTVEGGYPILIETNIISADCGGTVWAIRSDWDDGNRMYSAALTALATGSTGVQLFQSSCYSVGGRSYPRVGGLKVSK